MKAIKRLSFLLVSAAALVLSACGGSDDNGGGKEKTLVLKPSVETIKADGKAEVTFEVMLGDENVTSKATIENITEAAPVVLTGNKFTSDKVGTFKFIAKFDGKTSAEVTVTATSAELTVDKNVILDNGGVATFTVMLNDEDVTAESVITNITDSQDWAKGVNTFTASAPGEYEFKATYNGEVTNTVKVTVEKAPLSKLRLAASKGRIKPDGSESTTFTVYYEGNDVTSNAKVKNLATNAYVDDKTFSYSGAAKTVEFVAEYNDTTSPALSIGFGDFYKKVYVLKFTGTWCGPCGLLSKTFRTAFDLYPDREIIIAAHMSGQGVDMLEISRIAELKNAYGSIPGPPTTFYDIATRKEGGQFSSQEVISFVKGKVKIGANTGISAFSKIDGNTLTIDVNVTAAEAKEYYLGVMLYEDGISGYPQASDPEYLLQDHVLRSLGPSIMGESLGVIAENAQVTKTFTFDISKYNKENCNVVCYVTYKNDASQFVADNSVSCPAGEWVDYRFEK